MVSAHSSMSGIQWTAPMPVKTMSKVLPPSASSAS
jgi:hypothetical protein